MDLASGEQYLITKARKALETDPYTAKSYLLAAKTLYPKNFSVHYEAYNLEKKANNIQEAAKCFSYLITTFQKQPTELWTEVAQLTSALRVPEGTTTSTEEFYVKLFQNISYDIQNKILLLTANHSDNNFEHCKLILLLLKRFPQAIPTHSPRLLEALIQGIASNPIQFREILILEAIPLIFNHPPEISPTLTTRILQISLEYYVEQMFKETDDGKSNVHYCWQKILEILDMCCRILKWDRYLPYNKNWSKDIYWQRLVQIVSSTTLPHLLDNKQIFFCTTILFLMTIQEYNQSLVYDVDGSKIHLIMVDAFKFDASPESTSSQILDNIIEKQQLTVHPPATKEIPICFITAIRCWTFLQSNELLKNDFGQLMHGISLSFSGWINRFLMDLAIYLGEIDKTHNWLQEHSNTLSFNKMENNLIMLSSTVSPVLTIQSLDFMMKVLNDLPAVTGQWINNLTISSIGRHLTLLPVTRRAVIQYCTRILIRALKQKLSESSPTDSLLGNLLVLLQLDWPNEYELAEKIFDIIRQKRHFVYLQFSNYIVCSDFIEEFMYLWYPHGGDILLELSPQSAVNMNARRIGTRGADKGVKEDFKQIIRQQIGRSSECIEKIIVEFITIEHLRLVQNIFDKN